MCQYQDVNGVICGDRLEYGKNTSSLSYHLVNKHGLQKGAPAQKQKLMTLQPKSLSASGFILSEREQLCLTWACNELSYELVDDPHFRRSLGIALPTGVLYGECSAGKIFPHRNEPACAI